jgi:hypothetical protein
VGFSRSSPNDGLGMARLGIQLPVIEKILNHKSGTFRGIVGVYQRHSFAEEKRAAKAWYPASHLPTSSSYIRAKRVRRGKAGVMA